jgi:hypothetical protein
MSSPYQEDVYVEFKLPKDELKDEKRKEYIPEMTEESEVGSFYKSRITYQVSDQYMAKGKYATDDDDLM